MLSRILDRRDLRVAVQNEYSQRHALLGKSREYEVNRDSTGKEWIGQSEAQ